MKSNKQKAGLMALVALAAIGSYFIAGTYAKYTSEISGSDTATVAKWKWTINNSVIDSADDIANGYTFNLFDTIKDSDLETAETDVVTGKIAPGTSGSFDIDITNNSEVNAKYAISFTETNTSNVPIEYSTDGTTWVSSVGSLNVAQTDIAMNASSATKKVYWRWAYTGAESTNYTSSQTDATDTALGFNANTSAATVQVTATVTVTQAD